MRTNSPPIESDSNAANSSDVIHLAWNPIWRRGSRSGSATNRRMPGSNRMARRGTSLRTSSVAASKDWRGMMPSLQVTLSAHPNAALAQTSGGKHDTLAPLPPPDDQCSYQQSLSHYGYCCRSAYITLVPLPLRGQRPSGLHVLLSITKLETPRQTLQRCCAKTTGLSV